MRSNPCVLLRFTFFLVCSLLFFKGEDAWAATTSAKYAGTAVDSGGGEAWTNPSNATGDTTSTSAVDDLSGSGAVTNILQLTNFGFTSSDIPTNSTIDGILMEVEWQGEATNIIDSLVQLTKDGSIGVGDDKGGDAPQTAKAFKIYGGSLDGWNGSFVQTDIISSDFGVLLSYTKNSAGAPRMIDVFRVRMSVNYTVPASPPPPGPTPPPPTPPSSPTPSSGGGGGSGLPRTVVFSGQAYPQSTIEVFRKSVKDVSYTQTPTESSAIADDGTFTITHTGFLGADYLFALQARDKDGRSTSILAFNVSLYGDLFEAKDILIPPTIALSVSHITKNDVLQITGYAAPSYTVELQIDGAKYETMHGDQSGFWSFRVDTRYLRFGEHHTRVRQISPDGKANNFSHTRVFKVSQLLAPVADFTNDGTVDIADWSIFLFRWGNQDEGIRIQNDLNKDGKIDVFDFSVFLTPIKLRAGARRWRGAAVFC